MGKATRWLKGIFGMKTSTNNNTTTTATTTTTTNNNNNTNSGDRKRASFGQTRNVDSSGPGVGVNNNNVTASEAAWLKSYYADSEKEQSKHAIAVAAATAAAADAAVAAAQAAVAVVRLTSHARGGMSPSGGGDGGRRRGGGGGREIWAAVQIQTTFRGYLARKALRALKGLVKIQALVRGYLVRKQATATLHGMQALIRAQATVRSKRAQAHISSHINATFSNQDFRPRRFMEMFDDTRSEQAASVHSRRLSASFESRTINPIIEDIPKIVEVDPGRPRSSRGWRNNNNNNNNNFSGTRSEFGDQDPFFPPRLSIPSFHDPEWGLTGDECRFSTAHSTPRFMNPCGTNPGLGPLTPSKSVCGENGYYYFRHNNTNNNSSNNNNNNNIGDHNYSYAHHPNYMSNTQSFRNKVRSLSAPKQRPEPGSKKRLTLNEMMESRSSLSGVKMQRSCSQAQEAVNFKNAIMGKLHERSHEFGREHERYHFPRN